MSRSLVVPTTQGNPGQTGGPFPIRMSQATAQAMDSIAAKQQVRLEALVSEVLEEYIASQSFAKRQSGAAFLLSLAGMFNSGIGNVSENVQPIVADFLLKKQRVEKMCNFIMGIT